MQLVDNLRKDGHDQWMLAKRVPPPSKHYLRNPFVMDTSMLGRVAALLIRDLGRSRVIFLALARGQENLLYPP